MQKKATIIFLLSITALLFYSSTIDAQKTANADIFKLMSAMLSDTPIEDDLHELCDQIGGRVTGTKANLRAVEWGIQKFEEAGVAVRKEAFGMPRLWVEKSALSIVSTEDENIRFKPRVVSRAFSVGTPKGGLTTDLIIAGYGTADDFAKLGDKVKDQFILVKTEVLEDLGGLFKEYTDASEIEAHAQAAGVKGVVYMSSRPKKLLFRHLAAAGPKNTLPLIVMARDDATRCVRLVEGGQQLKIHIDLDLLDGGEYESHNVIGEIKGSSQPDEIIVIGAHLDSWGLGTGANDNGCNVSMLIDIARQMTKLEIQPKRTIRFALWNGEEQGMHGSKGYTKKHKDDLDKHRLAVSIDIGSGRITGFFTNGRPDVLKATELALEEVRGLGPFENVDDPLVGTDNFDFMLQGIPNLVGKHLGANYCADYHCESDTYDKVNLQSLKINSAIVATVLLNFANSEGWNLHRHSRKEVEDLIKNSSLGSQMKSFGHWDGWVDGSRTYLE